MSNYKGLRILFILLLVFILGFATGISVESDLAYHSGETR